MAGCFDYRKVPACELTLQDGFRRTLTPGEHYYRFNKYCLYDASVRVPLIMTGSALPEKRWNGIQA